MLVSLLILSLISFGTVYPLYAYFFLKDDAKFFSSCFFVLLIQTLALLVFMLLYRGLEVVGILYVLAWIIAVVILLAVYLRIKNLNKFSLVLLSLSSIGCYYIVHQFLLGGDLLLLGAGYLVGVVMTIIFSFCVNKGGR